MPDAAAVRLQLEIVRQMESRTKLRIDVNLPGGNKRLLVVRNTETTEQAARRFGLDEALSAQGIEALREHLDRQLGKQTESGTVAHAVPSTPVPTHVPIAGSALQSAEPDERHVLFVLPVGLPGVDGQKDLSLAVRSGDDARVLARNFIVQVRAPVFESWLS